MSDTIKEAIEKFNSRPNSVKWQIICSAAQNDEQRIAERIILDSMYKKGSGHFVVAIIGNMAILKKFKADEKHPYTAATKDGDNWQHTHSYWPSAEYAMLDAIGFLKEGCNSRFAMYAGAMIGLDKDWPAEVTEW